MALSSSSFSLSAMGGPYKRKKYHNGDTHLKKGWRTKRRTKDLDQVNKEGTLATWQWPSSYPLPPLSDRHRLGA